MLLIGTLYCSGVGLFKCVTKKRKRENEKRKKRKNQRKKEKRKREKEKKYPKGIQPSVGLIKLIATPIGVLILASQVENLLHYGKN